MADKEDFKEGVKKELIQKRIDNYTQIIESYDAEARSNLASEIASLSEKLRVAREAREAKDEVDVTDEELQEILSLEVQITLLERELESRDNADSEYEKANDVIDEVKFLIDESDPARSFVEAKFISERIDYYKKLLDSLDDTRLKELKEKLLKQLEEKTKQLEELKKKLADSKETDAVMPSQEYLDVEKQKKVEEIQEKIANREAMIVGRGDKMPPEKFQELEEWKEELAKLLAGEMTQEIIDNAREAEIKKLEADIANDVAMDAGGYSNDLRDKRIAENKARLEELKSGKTTKKSNPEIDKLQSEIDDLNRQITEIDDKLKALEERDPEDLAREKRIVTHRIEELEEIEKMKTLFRITENGEIEITYPEIEPELDVEGIKEEYAYRRNDMVDKYYGNFEKEEEYKEKMALLLENIVEEDFEYIDEDGKVQVGKYKTVKEFEGMEETLKFLQLEEYKDRLERMTKTEAGDPHAYDKIPEDKRDAVKAADKDYIETNNNAYNRRAMTKANLMTLGKYGEKVEYSQFQEGQPVRNALRAVGNGLKFVRNHVTAPINKFVGSKIVAPIYGAVMGVDKGKVSGLYGNKMSHRYVARREYFQAKGDGYFKSRFKSIFKFKEGNAAILSAQDHEIMNSVKKHYVAKAFTDARQKQIDFVSKSIEEKIEMLEKDIESATTPEAKAKLEATLAYVKKAQAKVAKDQEKLDNYTPAAVIQTDAVSLKEHDIANKENVTRTVTGVKMLARLGIRKFIGPKIKDWLLEHTQKVEKTMIETEVPTTRQEWVPATYRDVEVPRMETQFDTDLSMTEVANRASGNTYTMYNTVSGGLRSPGDHVMSEGITGIWVDDGTKWGTGLSDLRGLTQATGFTDRTFPAELLDSATGMLKPDVKVSDILSALNSTAVDPTTLQGIYISAGDNGWISLSDIMSTMTREVQVGTDIITEVDIPGHFNTVTEMVKKLVETEQIVPNTRVIEALNKMGVALNITDGALLAEDIYENTRKTTTEVKSNKPAERNYTNDRNYTGTKSGDKEIDLDIDVGNIKIPKPTTKIIDLDDHDDR